MKPQIFNRVIFDDCISYSKEEVKGIIQNIYSEFAELPLNCHTAQNLKKIIQVEVEQRPLKPIKIFNV